MLAGHACDLDWRPAIAGYFQFPGGFDAHIVALHVVQPTIGCSEYHDHAPYLLDHFVVTSSTRELGAGARTVVEGYCTESKCSGDYRPGDREIYDRLSDHCPVLLEFDDHDLDG